MTCVINTPTPKNVKELRGTVVGQLTVESFSHVDGSYSWWWCRCTCGKVTCVRRNCLVNASKPMKSCGCLRDKALLQRTTHGQAGQRTKEYRAWECMINRCTRQTGKGVKNYVGRGIAVCERWHRFEAFLEDMGKAPTGKHTVDRYPDKNGNYEPGNCRWATMKEQSRNKRDNRMVTIDGVSKCLAEWIEDAGQSYNTVLYRLRRGWPEREAIFMPLQKKGHRPNFGNNVFDSSRDG